MSHKTSTKFLVSSLVILLASCQPNVSINSSYEDENSELIPLLVTDEELSKISNQLKWVSILSMQEKSVLSTEPPNNNELASRKFRGYYQTSDNYVTIWQTVTRYNTQIDVNQLTPQLLGGVANESIISSYIPDIIASGHIQSKCVILSKSERVCEVDIQYEYVELNIYFSMIQDYGDGLLTNWINGIIATVEPRILLQDSGK